MQKTDHWKEQVSYYRFFRNENVTEKGLIDICINHCEEQSGTSKHVLLIEDTTELNLERHRGRITDAKELGKVGNNSDLGFFCHPTIAVDAEDGALLGALDIHLWHRPIGKKDKKERQYNKLPIEEKESYRWPTCGIAASKRLANKPRITILHDREGDIYENLCLLKEAGLDFVVRSHHNRKIAGGDLRIKEHIGTLSPNYEYTLEIGGESNKRKKKRQAKMEKLKNPFAKNNLAWSAWLIARMGGGKDIPVKDRPVSSFCMTDEFDFKTYSRAGVSLRIVYKR